MSEPCVGPYYIMGGSRKERYFQCAACGDVRVERLGTNVLFVEAEEAELRTLRERFAALATAASGLAANVRGMLSMEREALIDLLCITNVRVLEHWCDRVSEAADFESRMARPAEGR